MDHDIKLTDPGAIFLADSENIGVKQHHRPSSLIAKVCTYKESLCIICLNRANLIIPAHQIKIYEMIKLLTLSYFNTNNFHEISELTFRDYSRKLFWVVNLYAREQVANVKLV